MGAENLSEIVRSLTPEEQDAVRRFIDYLKGWEPSIHSESSLVQAADEFIAEHPDLLEHLAR